MPSVRRSLAVSFAGRYALFPLTLVSYVVVARLLTPEQIGIYSVAAALIGLAQVFRDFGTGSFLIQQKKLSENDIRSALGVSLFLGGGLFVIFAVGAPLAGSFYKNAQIVPIVKLIAINFLLLPFCSISLSLLRREMLFGRIAIANACGGVLGVTTTLGLAWYGMGPASLAWGAIVTNTFTGLTAWLLRTERRLLLPNLSEWRSILRFGGQNTFSAVVTSIAMDMNDLAVGRILGFAPVAMLSRAQGVMNLFHQQFMGAIHAVAYPAFARAHREGGDMEKNFVASVTNLTVFAWPFYGMAALYPLEILRLAFGPQWDAAAPLVPVFCAAGAIAAMFTLINPWMLAAGRVDLVTRGELIVQPLRAAIIVAAAFIFRSLMAVAFGFLLAFAVAFIVFYVIKTRSLTTNVGALRDGFYKSAIVSLASLAVPTAIAIYFGLGRTEPVSLSVSAGSATAALIVWIIAVHAFRHPIAREPVLRRFVERFALGQ